MVVPPVPIACRHVFVSIRPDRSTSITYLCDSLYIVYAVFLKSHQFLTFNKCGLNVRSTYKKEHTRQEIKISVHLAKMAVFKDSDKCYPKCACFRVVHILMLLFKDTTKDACINYTVHNKSSKKKKREPVNQKLEVKPEG